MYPKVTLSKSTLNKEIKTTKSSKSYEANDSIILFIQTKKYTFFFDKISIHNIFYWN